MSLNRYVHTWYDQSVTGSSGGKNATQTSNSIQPLLTKDASNLYMVNFTGTGLYLNLPDGTIPYNDSVCTMTVKHGIFNSSNSTFMISSGTNIGWYVNGIYYNSVLGYVELRSSQIVPNPIISYTENSVYTVKYDQSNFYLYLNSTLKGTVAKPALNNSVSTYNYIGGRQFANTDGIGCPLYNVSLFNTVLSDTDRVKMEGI